MVPKFLRGKCRFLQVYESACLPFGGDFTLRAAGRILTCGHNLVHQLKELGSMNVIQAEGATVLKAACANTCARHIACSLASPPASVVHYVLKPLIPFSHRGAQDSAARYAAEKGPPVGDALVFMQRAEQSSIITAPLIQANYASDAPINCGRSFSTTLPIALRLCSPGGGSHSKQIAPRPLTPWAHADLGSPGRGCLLKRPRGRAGHEPVSQPHLNTSSSLREGMVRPTSLCHARAAFPVDAHSALPPRLTLSPSYVARYGARFGGATDLPLAATGDTPGATATLV